MTLTQTEAIIIGSMIATVIIIVLGVVLCFFCGKKTEKRGEEPNYSKINNTPTSDMRVPDCVELITENKDESNVIIHVVEDENDDENDAMLIQSSNTIISCDERTNTISTTSVKHNETKSKVVETNGRAQNVDYVIEVDESHEILDEGAGINNTPNDSRYGRSITIHNHDIIDMQVNSSDVNDINTTHIAMKEDNEISTKYALDAEQIQCNIEKDIASYLLSDEDGSETWSEMSGSTATATWSGSTGTYFTVNSSTKWRDYKENLKHLFDLFTDNKPYLSWKTFNTFLEIVVVTNTNHWNLEVNKKITRDEFVEYLSTINIKKHLQRQVSWQLLTRVSHAVHEIDVTRSGILDYNSFRLFGIKLDLNQREIETLWNHINESEYVTVTDVFEWFKQRFVKLQALKQTQAQHESTYSSSCVNDDGTEISAFGSHSNSDADSTFSS